MPEEADWQHVNMVFKDALIIHYARIIDVTTLRDLHVGLPRGSFGFLFRGQRIGNPNNNLNTAPSDFNIGSDCGSLNSAFVDMQHDDVVAQSCSTNPVGGVSTLEEAQSWVIALQWSVAVCQKTMLRHSVNEGDIDHNIITSEGKRNNDGDDSSNRNINRNSEGKIDSMPTITPITTKITTAKNKNLPKLGRILVTKVYGFRIIRINKVAYEVCLLLIEKKSNKIEERRILLTAMQLEIVLEEMSKNIQRNPRTSLITYLANLQQQAENLPRFKCNLYNKNKNDNYNNNCTPQIVEASVKKIDGILRSLTMKAVAVNSRSMRQVFGLDVDRPLIEHVCWWRKQQKNSVIGAGNRSSSGSKQKGKTNNIMTTPVFFRQVHPIPSTVSVDDYVRQWLTRPSSPLLSSDSFIRRWQLQTQFCFFQRPWLLVTAFGVVLALAYPVSQIYQRIMISITMRLDILLIIYGVSYWLGQRRAQSLNQRKSRNARNATSINSLTRTATSKTRSQQENESNQNLFSNTKPISSDIPPNVPIEEDIIEESSSGESALDGEDLNYLDDEVENDVNSKVGKLSSPIPQYPNNDGYSCWSEPVDPAIFHVRGSTYLEDKVKVPSGRSSFKCRGVDLWMTDNPERHIARHPNVLGGKIHEEDTFLVNFLLPFGNFVAYFSVPPISEFPNKEVANVWSSFVGGDQQYRDARLKLLPVVIDGPWIVKAAVVMAKHHLLGKVIPLQYFFRQPEGTKKGIYEVDVIITASSIAKGILNVVKGHTKSLTIAFALIIEAAKQEELPETVLCSYQVHALNLGDCPHLPAFNLDEVK
eukprot:CAMPEP_0170984348 /NCGR_PEP_ID=MMETSP0736-20130129/4794_1 /TAXON_ID=186038 /ORGANISM="Fragilariopsis kerguelensis, Strain L26-C5" /LENGTH=813 /DNA_ID=CAMNT_0011407997 /DNA_START=143 /DNA_END=2585 /DNA_ORIENTATION=+